MEWPVHGKIDGPIVMIGFGSIGKGTLPLIERHFGFDKKRLVVVEPNVDESQILANHGVRHVHKGVTRDNYQALLTQLLTAGGGRGFCVNLSVDTSSLDIMRLCREVGALYVDTVVEPWPGFYFDKSLGSGARTNYALRQTVRDEKAARPGGPTAVSCCGANPGMVSWFVKQALVDLAKATALPRFTEPTSQEGWAGLARDLGVKGIHIAERDTQRARTPKPMAPSSTPGRSRASSPRACSPPSSAGGRMSAGCRSTPANTPLAARRRSISCSPAPTPASAHGARRPARNTASSSPTTSRSRSPTI